MRFNRSLTQCVLVVATLSMLLVLGGCPKHENLPTAIEAETASMPAGFQVVPQGFDSSLGRYNYDLTWTIDNAAAVDRYRLYLVGAGLVPQLVYETTDQEESQLTIEVSLPYDGEGLQFGLSSVSTGNVETPAAVAVIPPQPGTN